MQSSARLGSFLSASRLLLPVVGLLLAWIGLFLCLRGVLLAATWAHRGEMPNAMISHMLWHGLRFDLSMAAKLTAPFALWSLLRTAPSPRERRMIQAAFAGVSLVAIFALVAEVQFYREFQMRLGPLALEYFSTNQEHNAIIAGMIWHGYPVVRCLLLILAIWAAFVWVARRWIIHTGITVSWTNRAILLGAWTVATVVGVRGGWQGSPLRWGDAYWSSSTYANQMTENGLFTLEYSLRHRANERSQANAWTRRSRLPQAVAELRKNVVLPGEELLSPERYPLLRQSPPTASDWISQRPINVVLIIMESFSARFCGATGASFGATPRFDALAREGILFDRAFSVSTHTAQGVFATLCSVPTLPDLESIMKTPLGQQPFRSLPTLFHETGHDTLFLYNGLFSWDNKEGFFRRQGVERFIGRNDFVDPVFVDPDWGVSDLDVYRRAASEFSDRARTGRPFLGVILTLSNHAPFNLPPTPSLSRIVGGGDQNTRLNGVHYADWALGEFMDAARRTEWFQQTLFVLVGDHGFGLAPNITDLSLLHMHVPLLFYGPNIFGGRHAVCHVVAGQLDILPTIVGIAGLKTAHQAFGRDLFALPPADEGHAYVKRSGDPFVGWIQGEHVVVVAPGQPTRLHRIDLGFPPSASPDLAAADPWRTEQMKRALEAEVVSGIALLDQHLAAPPYAERVR